MISVYRDTLLDLSDGTLQKCNAAYSYGGFNAGCQYAEFESRS